MITRIDDLLEEWYQWAEQMPRKGLGYPSDYNLDRITTDQPATARVPYLDIPKRLVKIDRAIRVIPEKHRFAIEIRYAGDGKTDKEKAENAQVPYRTYTKAVDLAHTWIDGYIHHLEAV